MFGQVESHELQYVQGIDFKAILRTYWLTIQKFTLEAWTRLHGEKATTQSDKIRHRAPERVAFLFHSGPLGLLFPFHLQPKTCPFTFDPRPALHLL